MNSILKSKKLKGRKYKSVLVISDQHFPYQHPDLIPFLRALDNKYHFDLVTNSGDEIDGHSISFHESEPDLSSPADELDRAIEALQPLYKLFPEMELVDSNHGSLYYRKGKAVGLPSRVIATNAQLLGAPKGWTWSRDLVFETELGSVLLTHGKTSQAGKLSKNMAMNTIQGHYHSKFQIDYWGSPNGLYWDMHVGCLIDDHSRAMAYNKITLHRPIIGVGVVIHGRPQLIPMHLDKHSRWTGRL